MEFNELAKKVLRYNRTSNFALLEKAYNLAKQALAGKKRHSGEDSADHALQVAYVLADLKVDDQTLAAGLLHQVLENNISITILKREFGEEITSLVEGVSHITKIKAQKTEEGGQSNIRKMLLAGVKDVRVILIKLCDKLHNMRTLEHLPDKDKQHRIAQEVLDLYAPLAYRLGMGGIKSELEDIAFKYTHPKEYADIIEKIHDTKEERAYRTYETEKQTKKALEKENIDADVHGRVKHMYSVYRKMISKNYDFNRMYDLIGIRILVEDIAQCYNALRVVHTLWTPIPDTFKDYIANPKPNGYQSIHTVVKGVKDKPVEFQIRTKDMHENAEEGIAVHYGYKGVTHGSAFDKKLQWLKQLLEQKDMDSHEFMQKLKIDFFSDKIYVFTPKGRAIELAKESTPLDFAYAIHSDIGNTATGAMINGKYSSIKAELNNGDTVEIVTSKNHHPTTDWMKIVKTYKARTKIRQYLQQHGMHIVSTGQINHEEKKQGVEQSLIHIEDLKNAQIRIGSCCNPIPEEKITGMRSSENKIPIHRNDCINVKNNHDRKKREVRATWHHTSNANIELIINGKDRVGLLAEIMNTIARQNVNVANANGKALSGNQAEIRMEIKIQDTPTLVALIDRIKKIKDVKTVYLGEIKKTS